MITPEVPDTITTFAVLAWVESGPIAMALGVSAEPMMATLSLTISSCASRLELSGTLAVVLDDEVDLLAGDGGAVLVHVHLDAGLDLLADRREPAGERQHHADLYVLGRSAGRDQRPDRQRNS